MKRVSQFFDEQKDSRCYNLSLAFSGSQGYLYTILYTLPSLMGNENVENNCCCWLLINLFLGGRGEFKCRNFIFNCI